MTFIGPRQTSRSMQFIVADPARAARDVSQYVGVAELFNPDGTPWAPSGGPGSSVTAVDNGDGTATLTFG